jgi:hypothetical protein
LTELSRLIVFVNCYLINILTCTTVGIVHVETEMELNDDMFYMNSLPPTTSDVEMMDVSGDDAVPLEVAPTSPRAMDAAEAMLDLAWVQPVPTPLPTPEHMSFLILSPPPLPP